MSDATENEGREILISCGEGEEQMKVKVGRDATGVQEQTLPGTFGQTCRLHICLQWMRSSIEFCRTRSSELTEMSKTNRRKRSDVIAYEPWRVSALENISNFVGTSATLFH